MSTTKYCTVEFVLLFFIFVGQIEAYRKFYLGRPHSGIVGAPDARPLKTKIRIKDHWIVQKLDNFNKTNNNTWYNRYFARDAYYNEGGPIFLMLRGEESLSAGFMLAGAWVDYAKQFGAMLFQLEHRFYGDSVPTNNMSVDSLSYLTTEQSLADAANFIVNMTAKYEFKPFQKWIVFGGSYSGALSIWLSALYPHLVSGVVSSSGPVHLKLNFTEYMASVTEVIANHSQDCLNQFTLGFHGVLEKLNTYEGQYNLYNQFMLCNSAVHADDSDRSNLIYTLAGDLMNIVQYNNDNTISNYMSVKETCKIMLDKSNGTAVDRLATINRIILKEQGDNCVDFKYKRVIEQLQNSSLTAATVTDGDRQWVYQTCSQLGFFQTSDTTINIFGNQFPVNFFVKQCMDIFGPLFNETNLNKTIIATNGLYGGVHPIVKNVLAIQGSADPWHTVGITTNATLGVEAVFINGTSHCADMYSPQSTDSNALKAARVKIVNFLTKLIGNVTPPGSSVDSSSSSSESNDKFKVSNNQQDVSRPSKDLLVISKHKPHGRRKKFKKLKFNSQMSSKQISNTEFIMLI